MDERFLEITAESDREERHANRYDSPIARRSSGDVGETSASSFKQSDELHKNFSRCDCFGPLFEIEIEISEFSSLFDLVLGSSAFFLSFHTFRVEVVSQTEQHGGFQFPRRTTFLHGLHIAFNTNTTLK